MYRYSNGQISLADFKQPIGMNLKESNRWVKKAQTIPWPEIEKRYAALFTNRKGNVAKPLRLALGACIKLMDRMHQMYGIGESHESKASMPFQKQITSWQCFTISYQKIVLSLNSWGTICIVRE